MVLRLTWSTIMFVFDNEKDRDNKASLPFRVKSPRRENGFAKPETNSNTNELYKIRRDFHDLDSIGGGTPASPGKNRFQYSFRLMNWWVG